MQEIIKNHSKNIFGYDWEDISSDTFRKSCKEDQRREREIKGKLKKPETSKTHVKTYF